MPTRSALRAVFGNRFLLAALGVVWLAALLPIWTPRFLPLLDFPNHLGAMAILHRWHDPSWGYSRFYDLHLGPYPYWGHYYPVHLLAFIFPLEMANKIWISAYALTLPLGCAVLAEQLRRSPWLALLAAPFVFNYCFALGFLSFVGGAALFPWALYLLEAFVDEPTGPRGVALLLVSCGIYLMHVMPWLLFGLFAGVILVSHGRQPRRILLAAAAMLPSVGLALWGLLGHHGNYVQVGPATPGQAFSARFEPFSVSWKGLADRWLDNVPGGFTVVILSVVAVAWLGLVLTSRRSDTPSRSFRWRYELLLLASIVLYFKLPQATYRPLSWWYIAGRMTVFMAILAALIPRGAIDVRRGYRRWLLVPALLAAIAFPVELARRWARFDRRAAGFVRLMERVPRGSSTLCLMLGDPGDPDVDKNSVPYLEFHSLAQVMSGGFDPWSQATPLGAFPWRRAPAWRSRRRPTTADRAIFTWPRRARFTTTS